MLTGAVLALMAMATQHLSYGTCGLTYDASSADFIPYADLTEAQVQEWIWEQVNQADTEASIASKIDAIANPTTAAGTPWAA